MLGQRLYLGFYRLFYNAFSVVSLLPVLAWVGADPGPLIWDVEGAGGLVLLGVQGLGALGLLVSILQIDWLQFAGLRQALAYLAGEPLPLPPEPMVAVGMYRLVRHPLYLFSLLFIWAAPQMSAAWLGFCLGSTLYFAVGSLLEERKLIRQFGPAYLEYRGRVPWMIPGVKLPTVKKP
ncbi:MAG: isoprenylcysteine carboxylmethyltransferase family protein [Anaerolineae bacterium]|nr:isoprenylcysteine carboxylmethyltransferase family protein [Anaerolineae bacterium]